MIRDKSDINASREGGDVGLSTSGGTPDNATTFIFPFALAATPWEGRGSPPSTILIPPRGLERGRGSLGGVVGTREVSLGQGIEALPPACWDL